MSSRLDVSNPKKCLGRAVFRLLAATQALQPPSQMGRESDPLYNVGLPQAAAENAPVSCRFQGVDFHMIPRFVRSFSGRDYWTVTEEENRTEFTFPYQDERGRCYEIRAQFARNPNDAPVIRDYLKELFEQGGRALLSVDEARSVNMSAASLIVSKSAASTKAERSRTTKGGRVAKLSHRVRQLEEKPSPDPERLADANDRLQRELDEQQRQLEKVRDAEHATKAEVAYLRGAFDAQERNKRSRPSVVTSNGKSDFLRAELQSLARRLSDMNNKLLDAHKPSVVVTPPGSGWSECQSCCSCSSCCSAPCQGCVQPWPVTACPVIPTAMLPAPLLPLAPLIPVPLPATMQAQAAHVQW
ncbi:MAG: hypothetical protein KVP17_004559 [Porospora cf. gigantea B]|uniref:uncharacterized protein n=1 Tax=Porospora cf. gigantea B TaxID=2853592 RepID=UPI0035718041|nr:MAG: hypothetical protein KVP17_004559 [Porospora cf. gigantea B]